jgi:hypothetical protein
VHLLARWFAEPTSSTLRAEAISSSETSGPTQRTTRRHIPEDDTLHNHRCENLKSYTVQNTVSKQNFMKYKEITVETLKAGTQELQIKQSFGGGGKGFENNFEQTLSEFPGSKRTHRTFTFVCIFKSYRRDGPVFSKRNNSLTLHFSRIQVLRDVAYVRWWNMIIPQPTECSRNL